MSKPAPFKRPSIDMNRSGRTWQCVKANQLTKDDVVADRGLVSTVHKFHNVQTSVDCIDVYYINGEIDTFCVHDTVYAFVRKVEL